MSLLIVNVSVPQMTKSIGSNTKNKSIRLFLIQKHIEDSQKSKKHLTDKVLLSLLKESGHVITQRQLQRDKKDLFQSGDLAYNVSQKHLCKILKDVFIRLNKTSNVLDKITETDDIVITTTVKKEKIVHGKPVTETITTTQKTPIHKILSVVFNYRCNADIIKLLCKPEKYSLPELSKNVAELEHNAFELRKQIEEGMEHNAVGLQKQVEKNMEDAVFDIHVDSEIPGEPPDEPFNHPIAEESNMDPEEELRNYSKEILKQINPGGMMDKINDFQKIIDSKKRIIDQQNSS